MDEIWKDIDGFNGDYQVSTQGLINVFPSRNEAARSLGFDKGGIGHACHQDYKFTTYKGFIWRYEEDARKIIQKDVCT